MTKITPADREDLDRKDYYPFGKLWNNPDLPTSDNRYTFSGKEQQILRGQDIAYSDFGARFYDSDGVTFMQQDPLLEKYYAIGQYNYCAGNPVSRIDANGEDWYETLDQSGITWFEGNGQREGFTNIGETYIHRVDDTMSITYTQNQATSITYTALDESGFVSQFPDKTGCKVAADKMVTNSGATPSTGRNGEILMTNHDQNGVATTPTAQAEQGVASLLNALQGGKAMTVGVDYKPAQTHNLSSTGGDGMTDHFVTAVSSTTSLITGETTIRFFDPGTSHRNVGTQQSNVFRYNNGKLQGTFNKAGGRGSNNYTVTTVRKAF